MNITHHLRPLLLCTALSFGAVSTAPFVQKAHAQPAAKTLESVLKESGLAYSKNESVFRVYIENEGETTGVTMREVGIGDSPDLKLIYMFATVLQMPKGTKAPAPLVKRLAQINNNLFVGKLSLEEGAEGGGVYYNSSLWLKTATGETLSTELFLSHFVRLQFAKELAPFMKGE